MEVSVSPRETMCVFAPAGCGEDPAATAAAGLAAEGGTFSNHYARANVRDLLFQFENLLRKRVNLCILFVYFFCQRFKLSSII